MKGKKQKILAMLITALACFCGGALASCTQTDPPHEIDPKKGPEFGKVWFFAGQDMDAVGGLPEYGYDKGYVDYFGVPMGVTTYTNIKYANALLTPSSGTSGDMCVKYYLDSEKFDGAIIHLSVQFGSSKGLLDEIVQGVYDEQIEMIHDTLVYGADHIFFLRLGYEFDLSNYEYDPAKYAAAFRYIVDELRSYGDKNFVTCWASTGFEVDDLDTEVERLLQYYPGDEYVDWMGYSYFLGSSRGDALRYLAYTKNKPVFIAESTPKGISMEGSTAEIEWYDGWFNKFFEHIETNIATIKAVAYINQNWDAQYMWEGQGWGNSRLQANDTVRQEWADKISAEDNIFVHKKVEISDKEYVPDVMEVVKEPLTTGTAIEAEWGKFDDETSVTEFEDASNGKYVTLKANDTVTIFGVPAGKGLEIGYSSENDGTLTVEIVGKETYTVPFISSDGYMDLIYLMDDEDVYYPIEQLSTIVITSDAPINLDALFIKPKKGKAFEFGAEQIDALENGLSGAACAFSDNGVVGEGVQLAGVNGSDIGSAKFVAPCDGNTLAICYTRTGEKSRNLTLEINGEKQMFANAPTGGWNDYSCVFIDVDIHEGDEIVVSREMVSQSSTNLDGIYVFDKGIFNGSVALPEKDFVADLLGTYLSPMYALLEKAQVGEDGKVLLNQTGAKIAWYSLSENSSITLIYSAAQAGNVTVDINGTVSTVAFEKTDAFNPVKSITLRGVYQAPDGYVSIAYNDAPIAVKNVVLGTYSNGAQATQVTEKATMLWEGSKQGTDYPNYDFTNDIDNVIEIESSAIACDTLAIIAAGLGEVTYSVTVGDRVYSVKANYNGWGRFFVTYLVADDIPVGSKVVISAKGSANVHAVYGMKAANFQEVSEGSNTQDGLFNDISGAYFTAQMGELTNTTLDADNNAVLDAVGESIAWHNMPSYKDFYVVYKADTAGKIKAYYGNNYSSFYAFPVNATNGEYQTAYLSIASIVSTATPIPAGQSIKIVFEDGNVAVTVKEIIVKGYVHTADQTVTNMEQSSLYSPSNAATDSYPAYTNVNNTTLEITVDKKTNAILVVCMAKSGNAVNFTVKYNGHEYTGKIIGAGWNTPQLVLITLDEDVPQGGTVSLKIDNNINLCAVYGADVNDFKKTN